MDFDTEGSLWEALVMDGDGQASTDLDWILPNLDLNTCEAQSMKEELHRLSVLKSYLILDDNSDTDFKHITSLGARIFSVPVCVISLVDLGRQWFLSSCGVGDLRETSRKVSFCGHTIQMKGKQQLIVLDALNDPRFRDNALVKAAPKFRFYAGAPLMSPEGYKVRSHLLLIGLGGLIISHSLTTCCRSVGNGLHTGY